MTSLRLAIDASGMRRGAEEGRRALDDVSLAAANAANAGMGLGTTFDRVGTSASTASRSIRGVSTVLSGGRALQGTVAAVRDLGGGLDGVARAAQGSTILLLDYARVAETIRQIRLSGAVGETATAMGVLKSVMVAHPILTIAVVLGAAATAMSLFAGKTKESTKATQDLAGTLRSLVASQAQLLVAAEVGGPIDPAAVGERRLQDLRSALSSIRQQESQRTIFDPLAAGRAVDLRDVRRFIAPEIPGAGPYGEETAAFEFLKRLGVQTRGLRKDELQPGRQFGVGLDFENLEKYLRAELGFREAGAARRPAAAEAVTVPDRADLDNFIRSLQQETELLGVSTDERERRLGVLQAEAVALRAGIDLTDQERNLIREQIDLQRQLADARRLGEDVGAALANGLFNAARAGGNLRSVLAGIAQDLARIFQQMAAARLAGAAGQLFVNAFGATATQTTPAVAPSGGSLES
jgi:hypothetical protein